MAQTAAEMMAEARARVPTATPEEVAGMSDILIVDVREPAEVAASGKVRGAVNVPRAMLEARADPRSPSHDPDFDPDTTVILYCAAGGRAALAGATLLDLGYRDVRTMGGFGDWAARGLPVDRG